MARRASRCLDRKQATGRTKLLGRTMRPGHGINHKETSGMHVTDMSPQQLDNAVVADTNACLAKREPYNGM